MFSFAKEMFKLDPTASSEGTAIGRFRLNYATITNEAFQDMNENTGNRSDHFYFLRSEQYFTININAVARNSKHFSNQQDYLPITIKQDFKNNLAHTTIISEHTELYKRKANALVANDQYMWNAIAIALIAPTIPFIPFIGLLAIPAWIAAFYFLNQRNTLNLEYKDARTLLIATCSWALGPKSQERHATQLAATPEINSMMEQLYPILSPTQVEHLIADGIEKQYIDALAARDSRTKIPFASFFSNNDSRAAQVVSNELEKTALKQRTSEVIRCIYGHNRGEDEMDLLRVVTNFIFVDIRRAMYNAASAYYTPAAAPM